MHVVDSPTPNRLLMILSSLLEPSLVRQRATLCSTERGARATSRHSRNGRSSRHGGRKVALETRKFCFHSVSLQLVTARGKYDRFLSLAQTVLRCRHAVDSHLESSAYKNSCCCDCAAVKRRIRALAAMSSTINPRLRAAHLLRSHTKTKTTKTPSGQTSNAIFHTSQYVLTVYDNCRHVNGSERKPGQTRVSRPGFDPVACPCEWGI